MALAVFRNKLASSAVTTTTAESLLAFVLPDSLVQRALTTPASTILVKMVANAPLLILVKSRVNVLPATLDVIARCVVADATLRPAPTEEFASTKKTALTPASAILATSASGAPTPSRPAH